MTMPGREKKGIENLIVDHLFRLELQHSIKVLPINDSFPDEQEMTLHDSNTHSYADMPNFKAENIIPKDLASQHKKKIFMDAKFYY